MPLAHDRLCALIEAAGHEPHFHHGRDTAGRRCIAFTVRDGAPETRVMADIVAQAGTVAECVALLRGVRTNGVCGCTTFHWPDVSLPEETWFDPFDDERAGADSNCSG